LFQVESDRTPTAAPQPTLASGAVLVKISASGPIATSRYCDHSPSSVSAFLSRAADSLLEPVPDFAGAPEIAARPLLDHALDRRQRERHPRRLDRLKVDGREKALGR
jgi:hypothetical protein